MIFDMEQVSQLYPGPKGMLAVKNEFHVYQML